jgi:hypothetical protein
MKSQTIITSKPKLDDRIEAFVQLAQAAEEAFGKACMLLLELRQEYSAAELYPKIRKRLLISEAYLDKMCQAAQKRFPARLVRYPSPGAAYLESLSYDKAMQYSGDDLPVVVEVEQGFETHYKKFYELTSRQVRQVFDGETLRNAKDQASWLKRQRLHRAASVKAVEPFEIIDHCVLFTRDTKMTADDIEGLLRRLRKEQS